MIFIAFLALSAYLPRLCKKKVMFLISSTKTDGVPAGNNLIKWLLKIEQIGSKKRKYF